MLPYSVRIKYVMILTRWLLLYLFISFIYLSRTFKQPSNNCSSIIAVIKELKWKENQILSSYSLENGGGFSLSSGENPQIER